jgi:DNA-binding NarL/FixJ family response regulator
LSAIQCILAGELYVSAALKEKLLHQFLHPAVAGGSTPTALLSDRELQILRLIGEGNATRTIADQLGLSAKTIDAHREHIKAKLKLANSAELVRYAVLWMRSAGHD